MNCSLLRLSSCGSHRPAARAGRRTRRRSAPARRPCGPGVNGTFTLTPAFFAAFSTPALPASTIRSASETFLPPFACLLKSAWMPSSFFSTFASCAGWLTSQSFCGARRMRAPFAPPRLSEPRKVDAEAQAVDTSSETDRPEARILFFSAAMSASPTSLWSSFGIGSCQISSSFGTSRAEVARDAGPCRGA